MDETNMNYSPESKYLLNFSFSQKRLSFKDNMDKLDNQLNLNTNSNGGMSSNWISETSLEDNFILLRKKSLLKRKSMGSLKIFYSEIIDLKLRKSHLSTLYSSIEILYSKNGYSRHLISLSSSDGFAVRWFYDELVVRHSLFKSNLNEKTFVSNERRYVNDSNFDDKRDSNEDNDDKRDFGEDNNYKKDVDKDKDEKEDIGRSKNGILDGDGKKVDLGDENKSKGNWDAFMNQMNAEISEKRKKQISKQMKFDRCSSGEY